MSEIKLINYGADIVGGNGSGGTSIVCDDMGNNFRYILSEVDAQGAVVKNRHKHFARLTVEDLGKYGVEILRGVNDIPDLKPGDALDVEVGSHVVTITATAEVGILFNGTKPERPVDGNQVNRYPKNS